jgi:hypothetical protein
MAGFPTVRVTLSSPEADDNGLAGTLVSNFLFPESGGHAMHLSRLLRVLALLAGVALSTQALSALPLRARSDLLVVRSENANSAGQGAEALAMFFSLQGLGANALDPPLSFFEARAANAAGDPTRAVAALTAYLQTEEPGSAGHQHALPLLAETLDQRARQPAETLGAARQAMDRVDPGGQRSAGDHGVFVDAVHARQPGAGGLVPETPAQRSLAPLPARILSRNRAMRAARVASVFALDNAMT